MHYLSSQFAINDDIEDFSQEVLKDFRRIIFYDTSELLHASSCTDLQMKFIVWFYVYIAH